MSNTLAGLTITLKGLARQLFNWPVVLVGMDSLGNFYPVKVGTDGTLASAAGGGSTETPTITRATASGTVAAGAKSLTFITSSASPVIGNGVNFAGSILGVTRGPGESITIPVQPGNTLAAVVYTISGGSSLDIVKTV